jgi:hypothetical protein
MNTHEIAAVANKTMLHHAGIQQNSHHAQTNVNNVQSKWEDGNGYLLHVQPKTGKRKAIQYPLYIADNAESGVSILGVQL